MLPPRGLVQRLDQELHRSGLLPRCAKLLLAVSGGADSVALLRLLHAINHSRHWQWELVVGHVDHGIRGKAGAADARFVKSVARELEMPFLARRLRLGRNASEATARAARFRALHTMARQKKCVGAVLAHHADDQAETVLLRMIRGCGLDGLAAMNSANDVGGLRILRPLLHLRRDDLRGYLQEIGQSWREDETNATDAYLRNRVRAELVPCIERLSENAVEAISRVARLAGEAQTLIESVASNALAECVVTSKRKQVTLKRKPLQSIDAIVCGELVRIVVVLVGGSTETADFERTREAVRMIQASAGGKTIQMGRGVVIRAVGGTVVVEATK